MRRLPCGGFDPTSSMMKRTWTKRFLVQCWSCGVLTAWFGRSTTFSLFGRIGQHEYQARPCRAGIGQPKSYLTKYCLRSGASLRPSWTPGGHVAVHETTGGHGADIVVETAGTLSMSLGAAAWGGFVGVIGFTGDYGAGGWIFASSLLRCCECAGGSRSGNESRHNATWL